MGLVSLAASHAWVMPLHVYQTCSQGWHVSSWWKARCQDLGSSSSAFHGLTATRWAVTLSLSWQQVLAMAHVSCCCSLALGGLCSELWRGNNPIKKHTAQSRSCVWAAQSYATPNISWNVWDISEKLLFTGIVRYLGQSVSATTDVRWKESKYFFFSWYVKFA